jgi:hypothetical protein
MPNQNTGSGQLARKSQPRHDASFKFLQENVKREDLGTLLGISDDSRIIQFVGLLLSPSRPIQRRSLAKLAQMCELSYAELLRAIAQARVSEGILKMSEKMPEVMSSVATNACNHDIVCPDCRGTGDVPDKRKGKRGEYRPCMNCNASGRVLEKGDIDAQRIVFEAVGLTNRKSPLFNINMNKERPGELPSVESEMGGLGKVLDIRPVKSA